MNAPMDIDTPSAKTSWLYRRYEPAQSAGARPTAAAWVVRGAATLLALAAAFALVDWTIRVGIDHADQVRTALRAALHFGNLVTSGWATIAWLAVTCASAFAADKAAGPAAERPHPLFTLLAIATGTLAWSAMLIWDERTAVNAMVITCVLAIAGALGFSGRSSSDR